MISYNLNAVLLYTAKIKRARGYRLKLDHRRIKAMASLEGEFLP
jgi:hypothetical protein